MKNKSVFDLDENLAAALSYVLGPISGIFVLVMEQKNKFVRFHAMQSTLWFLMLMILGWILHFAGALFAWIPVIGWLFGNAIGLVISILGLISFISIIYLFIRAYGNATPKIPIIGEIAWKQVNR
jgi:uncharacterized membrane protein